LRPSEVDRLIGDASRERAELGAEKSVEGLIKMMVDADIERRSRIAASADKR